MNTEEFVQNTVQRTLSKYDERFSAVAESGSYDDLSDKPTIPEAYDDTALAARVTVNETAIADRYTKSEADALLDEKASLQVATIPGGGGGEEINALVSQGENSVSVNYYKDGELPNTLNLNVDSDYFSIPTTAYADEKAAQAQNNAQTYADLKLAQKQNTLVSGTNIKSINGESILGSGNMEINMLANYEVCIRDEPGTGNVVQIGTIKEYNDEQNLYQFFYRTDALANATVKTHPFVNLLADYTINDFIDATGMTSNGIFIGNGRTDNDNRLVVQQFSKNNKNIQIRAYKDFSGETALIKVIFKGKKNV